MSQPTVECIANYSEARRPAVIQAIAEAIQGVPQVRILDFHSDVDHNRTVITFIGPPFEIEEAAFRSIAKAAELINLDEHTGEHPRIGATDVVPFVPISGVSMQDCVALATRLGKRVGDELSIPVYLYEEAATRPERRNLEAIRRGEYEGLKVEITTNLERKPDFGPAQLGHAGATVIGARNPLIAYNVYLTTEDISIAKKIARAIRHSSGGLRYVKALEMLVDGRAQVSMNLTNYHGTPVARVVETIRREAQRYGVSIHHSELVGLIPQEALVDAAVWYLQLDQFKSEQILETKLYATLQEERLSQPPGSKSQASAFLDELAAGTPTPGGGSAAAFSGAAAAALVAMVARLTIGKKKYAPVESQMVQVLERAEKIRAALSTAVHEDAEAFKNVIAALKMPQNILEEQSARSHNLEQATINAMVVPLNVARQVVELLELAKITAAVGNLNAISDSGAAAALAKAALEAAALNVRINALSLENQQTAAPFLVELAELETKALQIADKVKSSLDERGKLNSL
jgi:glutamate formiminotransferase/formiminotetrahydrofolate cyclodeaminase